MDRPISFKYRDDFITAFDIYKILRLMLTTQKVSIRLEVVKVLPDDMLLEKQEEFYKVHTDTLYAETSKFADKFYFNTTCMLDSLIGDLWYFKHALNEKIMKMGISISDSVVLHNTLKRIDEISKKYNLLGLPRLQLSLTYFNLDILSSIKMIEPRVEVVCELIIIEAVVRLDLIHIFIHEVARFHVDEMKVKIIDLDNYVTDTSKFMIKEVNNVVTKSINEEKSLHNLVKTVIVKDLDAKGIIEESLKTCIKHIADELIPKLVVSDHPKLFDLIAFVNNLSIQLNQEKINQDYT